MVSRVLFACLAVSALLVPSTEAQSALPRGEVVFPDGTRVSVEVAGTPAARERGLMFRTQMAPSEGMVFVFEEVGFYPFWMKNTLIPLDMIWVDPTVPGRARGATRCRRARPTPARAFRRHPPRKAMPSTSSRPSRGSPGSTGSRRATS